VAQGGEAPEEAIVSGGFSWPVPGLASLAAGGSFWLPRPASTLAGKVDFLFNAISFIGLFFFGLIAILMVLFVWRYRQRPGQAAGMAPSHNTPLEITWSVIPLAIVCWMFWEGFQGYLELHTPPRNSYEVLVTGQKWKWLFTYPNGVVDDNLHVPAGRPVRLVLSSEDVIHSFFVPEFRIKRDAVPGRFTKAWFEAPDPGEYRVFCAEYCGTSHSDMTAKVVVHPPEEFERWLEAAGNFLDRMSPAEAGAKLFLQRGCKQCHSVDGAGGIGPTLKGIFGHEQVLRGGGRARVDEDYLRESILEPQAKVVAGYDPVMPTFKGRLTDREVAALIEYVKTLQ